WARELRRSCARCHRLCRHARCRSARGPPRPSHAERHDSPESSEAGWFPGRSGRPPSRRRSRFWTLPRAEWPWVRGLWRPERWRFLKLFVDGEPLNFIGDAGWSGIGSFHGLGPILSSLRTPSIATPHQVTAKWPLNNLWLSLGAKSVDLARDPRR